MQYQHLREDVEIVMNNPSEYIIPECRMACEILWNKNIETIMCSNYDYDQFLWISFLLTSEENIRLFEKKVLEKTNKIVSV